MSELPRETPTTKLSPDLPELRLLAQLAGVAPSRMADAFNDPEHMLERFTLAEMKQLQNANERLLALSVELARRCFVAVDAIEQGVI